MWLLCGGNSYDMTLCASSVYTCARAMIASNAEPFREVNLVTLCFLVRGSNFWVVNFADVLWIPVDVTKVATASAFARLWQLTPMNAPCAASPSSGALRKSAVSTTMPFLCFKILKC